MSFGGLCTIAQRFFGNFSAAADPATGYYGSWITLQRYSLNYPARRQDEALVYGVL